MEVAAPDGIDLAGYGIIKEGWRVALHIFLQIPFRRALEDCGAGFVGVGRHMREDGIATVGIYGFAQP